MDERDGLDRVIDEVLLLLPVLGRGIVRPTEVELEGLPEGKLPEPSQVSTGHIQIMISLASGPQSIGSLADALGVSRPAVTQLVDRLASYGMVERRPDPEDGRVVLVDYAPGEREIAQRIISARRRPLERAVRRLEEDEARVFLRGLTFLAEELRAERYVD